MDDSNAPATKADLAGALTAFETRLNERHDILLCEMRHMHEAVIERLAESETKILQAFDTFTQANGKAIRMNAVVSRVATLETRVLEVEKRLNMPPAV
jgi:hypothetical protein